MNNNRITELEWHGCYKNGWGGLLVPESFCHPAKVSFRLAERIYAFLVEEGYLREGDTVIDPFAGIGGFAIGAMRLGLNWQGVELEPRFVSLGNANIEMWNARYVGVMPHWGTALLVQGDSRRLAEIIAAGSASVSSPPYVSSPFSPGVDMSKTPSRKPGWDNAAVQRRLDQQAEGYGSTPGQLGAMREGKLDAAVSSPPYAESMNQHPTANDTERRIERMAEAGIDVSKRSNVGGPNGVARQPQSYVEAAVSSPPYADGGASEITGVDDTPARRQSTKKSRPKPKRERGYHQPDVAVSSPPYEGARIGQESGQEHCGHGDQYGPTAGQLGAMKAGEIEGAISSPPYEHSMDTHENHARRAERTDGFRQGMDDTRYGQNPFTFLSKDPSGLNNDERHAIAANNPQVGALDGETFWSASRLIVEQVYQVLAPGGVCAWVVKDFVRNKERVPFCDQWRQLCEACGFQTFAVARAWLVEERGTQLATDGKHKHLKVERKSFFRRLAEKKGSPRVDYEIVIFMRKPEVPRSSISGSMTTRAKRAGASATA